jgi:hypothetical protein
MGARCAVSPESAGQLQWRRRVRQLDHHEPNVKGIQCAPYACVSGGCRRRATPTARLRRGAAAASANRIAQGELQHRSALRPLRSASIGSAATPPAVGSVTCDVSPVGVRRGGQCTAPRNVRRSRRRQRLRDARVDNIDHEECHCERLCRATVAHHCQARRRDTDRLQSVQCDQAACKATCASGTDCVSGCMCVRPDAARRVSARGGRWMRMSASGSTCTPWRRSGCSQSPRRWRSLAGGSIALVLMPPGASNAVAPQLEGRV